MIPFHYIPVRHRLAEKLTPSNAIMHKPPANPERPRETPPPIPTIPESVARRFVQNRIRREANLFIETPQATLIPLASIPEHVPGIGDVSLNVVYRYPSLLQQDAAELFRFFYEKLPSQSEKSPAEKPATIADAQLVIYDSNHFELKHRYVHPEFRRKHGLGTRLYGAIEAWLQQVAALTHQPVSVRMSTGQRSVFAWAEKMGFAPLPHFRNVWTEVEECPDHFVEAPVYISEESRAAGIEKDLYLFRPEVQRRYMEDAVRITFEKVIQPPSPS